VEDTLAALQELAVMHRRRFRLPVVAITGSNGKTTTKEMLASILSRRGAVLRNEGNLNNHIGVPLTLFKLDAGHRAAVIEMGMSGFGEIALLTRLVLPTVGVITNIGPAHLQFLGSTDGVAKAKGELLETMRSDGTAVLNADDPYFGTLRARFSGRTVSFGMAPSADVRASDVDRRHDSTGLMLHAGGRQVGLRLAAVGMHNVANALAAAAAATALEVPLGTVKAGLEEFRPVAMRSELRVLKGRTFIADCYNANPASMLAALGSLAELGGPRSVAVLGDMLELGDAAEAAHREAGAAAARLGIGLLIVAGPLSRHVADGARAAGMAADRVLEAASSSDAARLLRERTRPGDTILVKGSRGMRMERTLEEF
jgi:UDP-N-acetylmuramoyl-tripeptide--D-alanyl-D-alanine ligase